MINLKELICLFAVSSTVVGVSYSFSGPSLDDQKEYRKQHDEFTQKVLIEAAGADGILDSDEKSNFISYLGFPDTIHRGEDIYLRPARSRMDYQTAVFVGSGPRKLGNVSREKLEAYFPGREKY